MVGEQIVRVDEAADRTLECKAGIAEAIRDQKYVIGFRTRFFFLTNSFDCQASDSEIMFNECTVHRSSCCTDTFIECFVS